jgi:plastocyanin
MRWMKGRRALAGGMLVLALSCAIPAISAAQDAGTTTEATTTTTTTPTAPAPTPPAPPADKPNKPAAPAAPPTGSGAETSTQPQDASASVTAPVAGASSTAAPKARKSASASVTMGDLFFSPASVTVAVGDTVTWRNTGQAPHNATADDGSFKTPTIENGQSASHTFNQAGTFSYICTIHPQMKGTIQVLASDNGGGGGGGGNGGGASSSSSSGSSTSESAATASPNAAGDANTLPMTGMAVGGLALVGLGLLALGLIARLAERDRARLRWFSIF